MECTDLLKLNQSGKPLAVTGIARSGTTALQRMLWRQSVIENPDKIYTYLDEAYRILPGVYDIEFGDYPFLKPYRPENIDYDAGNSKDSYLFPWRANNKDSIRPYLRVRIAGLKNYSFENTCTKVFPVDISVINQHDPDWAQKILKNHFWYSCVRQDFIASASSFFYATQIKQWHHFGDMELEEIDCWFNPLILKQVLHQQYGNLYNYFKDTDHTIIYKEDLEKIEDNYKEFKDLEFKQEHVQIGDAWLMTPKILEKEKVYDKYVSNYETFKKKVRRLMESICKETNGYYVLDGDKVFVDDRFIP